MILLFHILHASRLLLDCSWPGNVRELSNVIEYAVVVARRETIQPEDLPLEIQPPVEPVAVSRVVPRQPSSGAAVEDAQPEADRLRAALEKHRWKKAAAAKSLGMSRSTLWWRMRELHLG